MAARRPNPGGNVSGRRLETGNGGRRVWRDLVRRRRHDGIPLLAAEYRQAAVKRRGPTETLPPAVTMNADSRRAGRNNEDTMNPRTTKELLPEEKQALLVKIRESKAYLKAYADTDFMGRKDLRAVRLQLELLKPELILREHKIRSTIVVFGSARILSPEEALRRVKSAQEDLAEHPRDVEFKRLVADAEKSSILAVVHAGSALARPLEGPAAGAGLSMSS